MSKTLGFLMFFFMSRIVVAEIYDPFYLKSHFDYVTKLAWLEHNGHKLFYYDIAIESEIDAIVTHAQNLVVFIEINTTNMGYKLVDEKWVRFLKKPGPMTRIIYSRFIKVLKNRGIPFEWAIIPALEFQKTCAPLVYSIKSRVGIYWLNDKQEEELMRLAAKKAVLKVNLTVIKGQSPYRLIPANKVFMAVTG